MTNIKPKYRKLRPAEYVKVEEQKWAVAVIETAGGRERADMVRTDEAGAILIMIRPPARHWTGARIMTGGVNLNWAGVRIETGYIRVVSGPFRLDPSSPGSMPLAIQELPEVAPYIRYMGPR